MQTHSIGVSKLHELFNISWSDWDYIISGATALITFFLGLFYQARKNHKEQEQERAVERQERAKRDEQIQQRLYELQENQLDSNEKLIDATNRLYEQIGKQSESMGNQISEQGERIEEVADEVDDHETRITKLEKFRLLGVKKYE